MEVATEWIWGEQESSPPKPPSNIFSFFSESSEAKGPLLIYFVMLVEQNIYEYRKCVCMHIRACISMCVYPHTWMHVNVTATFYLFIFKLLLLLFLLYNIVLVFPYINMHLPWVYTCCPSWTPLPPASPYYPSGSSQCTSPKLPVSCIEPGLAIRFLYDIIHVLMPFSQIIPRFPLPQSPKDCSINLCLFCCLAYRVIITIFLNSIYMC